MRNLDRLRRFVRAMTELVAEGRSESALLDQGAVLLAELIGHDDWLPDAFAAPSEEGYRQYLLHCDALERFSVVSFVWRPGQRTPVHDHLTWGLVGQLRGEEQCEEFMRVADGGYRCSARHRMRRGDIDRVSPAIGDVHAVSNTSDATSVSIHVYGANIGRQNRHVFDAERGSAREFVSGYHNATTPNLWSPQVAAAS